MEMSGESSLSMLFRNLELNDKTVKSYFGGIGNWGWDRAGHYFLVSLLTHLTLKIGACIILKKKLN